MRHHPNATGSRVIFSGPTSRGPWDCPPDAEAFEQIVFVVERLGVYLTRSVKSLGPYAKAIITLAAQSPLAEEVPSLLPTWHTPFGDLYYLVQDGRNDALHQGAFARHLTNHTVELALILEDALMTNAVAARDLAFSESLAGVWRVPQRPWVDVSEWHAPVRRRSRDGARA